MKQVPYWGSTNISRHPTKFSRPGDLARYRTYRYLHISTYTRVLLFRVLYCANPSAHVVAQLVEALRYKPEGRRFDSRWCHWNFSLTWSFRLHYGPGVDSASNRNEYQEYFLGSKSGSLTPLEPSGTVQACTAFAVPLFLVLIGQFLYGQHDQSTDKENGCHR
jgi:hypothetical protein